MPLLPKHNGKQQTGSFLVQKPKLSFKDPTSKQDLFLDFLL